MSSNSLSQILPPNRIAVVASILTSLTAFITGVAKTLPGTWENYALAATGLLGQIIATLKFLEGSQKWDQIQGRERLEHIRQRTVGLVPVGSAVTTFDPPTTYRPSAQDE